jgi:FdhD protein
MTRRRATRQAIVRLQDGASTSRFDHLAAEEPMEVRIDGDAVTVTMRTPGDDFELAAGLCLAEGLVTPGDIAAIRYCAGVDERGHQTFNVVDVQTRTRRPLDPARRRRLATTSACGLCGTSSIDALRRDVADVAGDPVRVSAAALAALPDRLREAQTVFDRTGGLHAAGLFTGDGSLVCAREDVGRHNAVDKVLGWAAMGGALPLSGHVLVVSGRVAFEIVQKALVAGVPVVAAVSAPTSLAVALAGEAGMTLAGFVRGGTMNVYSGAHRVIGATAP